VFATTLFNRLLRRFGLERRDGVLPVRMGLLVAVLLGAYTIAKVLRDSLFISEFGARALPYGYVAVAIASVALVKVEPFVTRYLPRVGVVALGQLAAIACSVAAAVILPLDQRWFAAAFYVWAGSQGMMLVVHFWGLAHDVWDTRGARRVFPLLAGCGLAGGVVGGAVANLATPYIGLVGLLWCVAGLLVLVRFLTANLGATRHFKSLAAQPSHAESRLRLVIRSPLLKFLAASIALSVFASTLVDFQFKQLAYETFPDRQALTRFLGVFHAGLDGFAILVQFGIAGWILRHVGMGLAAGIQPASVLMFSAWMMLSPAWSAVLALRWIQGVAFQTVGKSVAEIQFMAVRPVERRRVKPAIDVVVERGADALVGLLLIVGLHLLGLGVKFLAGLTVFVGAIWIVVQIRLKQEYTRAFRDSLSGRWVEPEAAFRSLRNPAVRQALIETLKSDDERQVVTALDLCRGGSYLDTNLAVKACLRHRSPKVRAAAVRTMDVVGIQDSDGVIRSFLSEADEELRRAAVEYLMSRGPDPTTFARDILGGNDLALRDHVLDVLAVRPNLARGALSLAWIDRCIESGTPEDLVAAGRALGCLGGRAATQRLHLLLRNPNLEAQRSALRSVALRPAEELLDAILPLLLVPELRREAREAIAALGEASVPALKNLLKNEDPRVRQVAGHALARIETPGAIAVLTTLARSQDPATRYLGLRNLNRVRRDLGHAVMSKSLAHRMFVRDLSDYRGSSERATALGLCQEPEVRLLADSYRESADRALDRAFRALGCWYEPHPLEGVYRGLRSGEREGVTRSLEYLSGVLPRRLFMFVQAMFEAENPSEDEVTPTADPEIVAQCISRAWEAGDGWLRACAVRAARVVPGLPLSAFSPRETDDPLVSAELDSLALAQAGTATPGVESPESGAAAPRLPS